MDYDRNRRSPDRRRSRSRDRRRTSSRDRSPKRNRSSSRDRRSRRDSRDRDSRSTSLFVRNVSSAVDENELRRLMGRFGTVKDLYIPKDFYSKEPRGFAFVEYVNYQDARTAQAELDRYVLDGKALGVVFAKDKRKTPDQMKHIDGGSNDHRDGEREYREDRRKDREDERDDSLDRERSRSHHEDREDRKERSEKDENAD